MFWPLPRAVKACEAGACNLHPVPQFASVDDEMLYMFIAKLKPVYFGAAEKWLKALWQARWS